MAKSDDEPLDIDTAIKLAERLSRQLADWAARLRQLEAGSDEHRRIATNIERLWLAHHSPGWRANKHHRMRVLELLNTAVLLGGDRMAEHFVAMLDANFPQLAGRLTLDDARAAVTVWHELSRMALPGQPQQPAKWEHVAELLSKLDLGGPASANIARDWRMWRRAKYG